MGAGVVEVYYLEPYAKSQADDLYPDSISIDPSVHSTDKVNFLQFCGVTKRRFHYFSKEKLKDKTGQVLPWSEKSSTCLIDKHPTDYIRFEVASFRELKSNKKIPFKTGRKKFS